ncbi:hypothetical protein MSG28_014557 [Choristoneura fumiferana]|uniref:Uncharacterized protein n=1 Tax=Choristoneura fumiferana TaxID=7141 RepID=A0ACC0JSG9_CHOFU|nr:hypothetical protein MSG28_014557 [Choristoneura fumiferana]
MAISMSRANQIQPKAVRRLNLRLRKHRERISKAIKRKAANQRPAQETAEAVEVAERLFNTLRDAATFEWLYLFIQTLFRPAQEAAEVVEVAERLFNTLRDAATFEWLYLFIQTLFRPAQEAAEVVEVAERLFNTLRDAATFENAIGCFPIAAHTYKFNCASANQKRRNAAKGSDDETK